VRAAGVHSRWVLHPQRSRLRRARSQRRMAFVGFGEGRAHDVRGDRRAPAFLPLTVYRSVDGGRDDAPDMPRPRALHLRGLADLALGQKWARAQYRHMSAPDPPRAPPRDAGDADARGLTPAEVRVGDLVRSSEATAAGMLSIELESELRDLRRTIAASEATMRGGWETLAPARRAEHRSALDGARARAEEVERRLARVRSERGVGRVVPCAGSSVAPDGAVAVQWEDGRTHTYYRTKAHPRAQKHQRPPARAPASAPRCTQRRLSRGGGRAGGRAAVSVGVGGAGRQRGSSVAGRVSRHTRGLWLDTRSGAERNQGAPPAPPYSSSSLLLLAWVVDRCRTFVSCLL